MNLKKTIAKTHKMLTIHNATIIFKRSENLDYYSILQGVSALFNYFCKLTFNSSTP